MFFQNIPVFRMAYFTIKPYYGLISKTFMLQVRSAHPPMPHRNVFSKHPGVSVGLFSDSAPTHLRCAGVPLGLFGKPKRSSFSRVRGLHQAILWPLLQNARPSGSLRSPLHPPLPPPVLLPLPCTKRGCFSWRQTAPASLCAFRSYSSPLPLMSTSRPPMSTRTTSPLTSITSPRQSTMSASLPASMEPTRSATPMCSAGQRVMARSAS